MPYVRAARWAQAGTAAVSSLANAGPYISHHLFYLSMFLLQVPSAYRTAGRAAAACTPRTAPDANARLLQQKNIYIEPFLRFNTVRIFHFNMMRYLFRNLSLYGIIL